MRLTFVFLLLLTNQALGQTIAGGNNETLAICPGTGNIQSWGAGLLGNGKYTERAIPGPVPQLNNVVEVAVGYRHALALKKDGTVWAWGDNRYGQLGTGSNTNNSYTPVQVAQLDDVISIAAGNAHSIVVKADGTVWTWGDNEYGQLGDGTTTEKHTPVQVESLTNVVDVAAGMASTGCGGSARCDFSLVLKSDGTVWAWGANYHGQLGDGTNTDRHTPVQVQGLSDVAEIAAGVRYGTALTSDSTVWEWGDAPSFIRSSSTPQKVESLENVIDISANSSNTLALKADSTVWAWGSNQFGGLGIGSEEPYGSQEPVQVNNLSNVTHIAAGGNRFNLAMKADGSVYGWGYNDYGQLGNNTTTNQYEPVKAIGFPGYEKPGNIYGKEKPFSRTDQDYAIDSVPHAHSYTWTTPEGWKIKSGQGDTAIKVKAGYDSGKICVTANGGCGPGDTACIKVDPHQYLGSDTTLCEGDTLTINPLFGANDTPIWSTGDTAQSLTITESGNYHITVFSDTITRSDSIKVTFGPIPKVYIGPSQQAFCGEIDHTFDPETTHANTYQWNTGDTTKTLSVTKEGTYRLRVESEESCANADTSEIQQIANPKGFQKDKMAFCESKATLDAGNPGASHQWSTGETTQKITVEEDGVYRVTIANDYCSINEKVKVTLNDKSECPYFWMPNAFSPNKDGLNEALTPVYQNLKSLHLKIFNRWGEKVFEKKGLNAKWDATYKGKKAPQGNYFYTVNYEYEKAGIEHQENENGTLKLIR